MIEAEVMEMLTLGTAAPIAIAKEVGVFSLTISYDTAPEAADVIEHTAQSKRQKTHCGKQESSYDHSLWDLIVCHSIDRVHWNWKLLDGPLYQSPFMRKFKDYLGCILGGNDWRFFQL